MVSINKLKDRSNIFEYIGIFSEDGYAYAREKGNGKWCVIDIEGNIITKLEKSFTYVGEFSEGLSCVSGDGRKFGVINTSGETIIDFKYQFINKFHNGLSVAKKNGLNGVINSKDQVVIPFKYSGLSFNMKDGIGKFTVMQNAYKSTVGYIDIEGNEIVFNEIKVVSVTYLTVRKLLNQEPVCVKRIRDIKPGNGALYSIKYDEHAGRVLFKVTSDNRLVVYQVSGNVLRSNENIFVIQRDYFGIATKGYCDIYGNMLMESKELHYISNFENGFGVVGCKLNVFDDKKMKFSFVNSDGKIFVPFRYDSIQPLRGDSVKFKKGIAKVIKNGKVGLIDVNGNELVLCKYKNVMVIYHGVAACYDFEGNLYIEIF